MRLAYSAFPFLLLCSVSPPFAQQHAHADPLLASTPPMGWNSWDSYGLSVTESEFKANTDWLARNLKQYGWQYVVVDEGWYLENPDAKPGSFRFVMDTAGRFMPATNRFPSAARGAGFKKIADDVHALGLKFGIHIIRGIPKDAVQKNLPIANSSYHAADAADQSDTCPWNKDNYGIKANTAGQAYYDSIARLYASWGVDFVKVDCIASHPYKGEEIRMVSEALRKTGRAIVLSLSPGPAPVEKADELSRYAQMWRISDDFWDQWKPLPQRNWPQSLLGQFENAAKWASYTGTGHWPDADMLPIGYLGPRPGSGAARKTRLTPDEQRTLLTLWCIFRSPLIMGGNLTMMDSWTTSLLSNPDVLAVNQHSVNNHQVLAKNEEVVWMAQTKSKKGYYIAVFNLSDTPRAFRHSWQDIGLAGTKHRVRSLWEHRDLGVHEDLTGKLEPHASVLYLISDLTDKLPAPPQ
jgi:hypothetical protein